MEVYKSQTFSGGSKLCMKTYLSNLTTLAWIETVYSQWCRIELIEKYSEPCLKCDRLPTIYMR